MGAELCARPFLVLAFLWAVTAAFPLNAQEPPQDASRQIWANLILARPTSQKLYLEYDIEGAYEVSDEDPFKSLFGTGLVEYYPKPWLDLTGELVTGFSWLSAEENSFEASVRLGARFHLADSCSVRRRRGPGPRPLVPRTRHGERPIQKGWPPSCP